MNSIILRDLTQERVGVPLNSHVLKMISGACKRTHRDTTNIQQLNQRIYVSVNPVLLVRI